jgi:uncharacterized membrane protein YeaQ/YmgE (transglycosylase-associated protein family)
MYFLIALVIAGLVGWLGSLIMRTDSEQGVAANIVLGGLGSLLGRGGWQLTGREAETLLSQFLLSLAGTLIVIFIWRRFAKK